MLLAMLRTKGVLLFLLCKYGYLTTADTLVYIRLIYCILWYIVVCLVLKSVKYSISYSNLQEKPWWFKCFVLHLHTNNLNL